MINTEHETHFSYINSGDNQPRLVGASVAATDGALLDTAGAAVGSGLLSTVGAVVVAIGASV